MRSCDLTGQTFGHWTVLERAESDTIGRSRWLCRCSCGKERIVSASNLRQGVSTSCGHLGAEKKRSSLIGQTFGRLTVLRSLSYGGSCHQTRWLCHCACGNETAVTTGNLRCGHTTSCGCVQAEAQQSPDARVAALKTSPLTGAFETNIRAKEFVLEHGDRSWTIRNLSKFVRDNPELLGIEDDEYEIKRTTKALYDAAHRHYAWHGWRVTKVGD